MHSASLLGHTVHPSDFFFINLTQLRYLYHHKESKLAAMMHFDSLLGYEVQSGNIYFMVFTLS